MNFKRFSFQPLVNFLDLLLSSFQNLKLIRFEKKEFTFQFAEYPLRYLKVPLGVHEPLGVL